MGKVGNIQRSTSNLEEEDGATGKAAGGWRRPRRWRALDAVHRRRGCGAGAAIRVDREAWWEEGDAHEREAMEGRQTYILAALCTWSMWLIYQILRAIALPFSFLFGVCMMGFGSVLGLSAGRAWLWPVTILLVPIALLFAVLAIVFYCLTMLICLPSLWGLATHGAPNDTGIRITFGRRRLRRVLGWADIREFRRVFSPPFDSFRAILRSGEVVPIDFIEINAVTAALEERGIPFLGRDRAIDEYEG